VLQLDSLKSRLQSSRESLSLPRLASSVIREEGVGGYVSTMVVTDDTVSGEGSRGFYNSTRAIAGASRWFAAR
jgi:solute carrier family 25 carnitine/acylcarnitine transporter 20/29